jgi:endo-1,4-beta-mannosidase
VDHPERDQRSRHDAQPFTLGVNYWPRRKAMYWWRDFDSDEVQEEFEIIAGLGLRLVRIFLLWEDWQPTPVTVAPNALRHLEVTCDIAASLGLELDVTFFTGHMSGPSWVPGWMLQAGPLPSPSVKQVVSGGQSSDHGYANAFTDPVTLQAAELLLETVVSRFRDHPGFGLWNLGNEPDLFAWPPSAEAGRAWTRRMSDLIRSLDSRHPVTCGLHTKNLFEDNGLRVHDVFAETDLAVMHGYPMYVEWAAGPLDPDFVPFLCALTTALCGKPALMEEFGGCTEAPGQPSSTWKWVAYGKPRTQFMASEAEFALYIEQVLPRLVEVGATGAVLWCYADYAPELYGRPPCDQAWHERYFGLVRPDGSLKPHAEVLRRFAAAQPVIVPAQRMVELNISPQTYYQDPLGHARRLYQRFRDPDRA